jgi:hypothetical protein
MTTISPAGYIVQDRQSTAIYGAGLTVEAAWAMAVDGAGPFRDAYGNELTNDDAFARYFRVYGATQELLDLVARNGGAQAWHVVGGVACTMAEYNALHA